MTSNLPAKAHSAATLHCSFCGRDNASVRKMIAGPGVHICDACVATCQEILDRRAGGTPPSRGSAEPNSADARAKDFHFGNWNALSDAALLSAVGAIDGTLNAIRGVQHAQVGVLRERGVNWATIGTALGVSRQSAWERFGKDAAGD